MKILKICIFIYYCFTTHQSFATMAEYFKNENNCPPGTIEDVWHKCQPCDTSDVISLGYYRDVKTVMATCPNRFMNGYKRYSFPTTQVCQKNEFFATDGKCHSCDDPKEIESEIPQVGFERVTDKCPNRVYIFSLDGLEEYTGIACPTGYITRENREGKFCDILCPDNSIGKTYLSTGCKDIKTGKELPDPFPQ